MGRSRNDDLRFDVEPFSNERAACAEGRREAFQGRGSGTAFVAADPELRTKRLCAPLAIMESRTCNQASNSRREKWSRLAFRQTHREQSGFRRPHIAALHASN